MRNAKSNFFDDRIDDCSKSIDPKKTWTLINSLLGKNNKSNKASELSVNENVVSDSKLMADIFHNCFLNIGLELAANYDDESSNNYPTIDSTQGRI